MKLKLSLLLMGCIYSIMPVNGQNKYIDSSINTSKTYAEKHLIDNSSDKVNKGIDDVFSGKAFKKKKQDNAAATTGASTVEKGKTQIVISNTNYQALSTISDVLKSNVQVTDVEKSFADGVGTLKINHSCTPDQLLDDLVKKAGDKFEVEGIENGKITLKMK